MTGFAKWLIAASLASTCASAQLRQIDRTKLPQTPETQQAYDDLLPVEQYARTYEAKWRFPVPKAALASKLSKDVGVLERQQQVFPTNTELQILTGLVAHFAYNLEDDQAFQVAMRLLQEQAKDDWRAKWFLGIHMCQSRRTVEGMQELLAVEASNAKPPSAFWQDYANCASVTNMPVHAVRAYDLAHAVPDGTTVDPQLEQIARNHVKAGDLTASYKAEQVVYAEKRENFVRFTNTICGESFDLPSTAPVKFSEAARGSCSATIETPQYSSKHGKASGTVLVLTQAPRNGESLESFSERLLKDARYSNRTPIEGLPCPGKHCLSYEIKTNQMYGAEGGAHLLAVFFQSDEPKYSGLLFESPQPLPKADRNSFFRPNDYVARYPGMLYTFLALDANESIYPNALKDFTAVVNSLTVDTAP